MQLRYLHEKFAPLHMQVTLGLESCIISLQFLFVHPCSNHNKTKFVNFVVVVDIQNNVGCRYIGVGHLDC